MDQTELYDSEIAKIGPVWQRLNNEFMTRAATEKNIDELKMRAHEEFLKIGLVARVEVPVHLVEGGDGTPIYSPPEIVIEGRIPGSELSNSEDGIEVMDHERKRAEVLLSKDRGEQFAGEKEKPLE